MQKEKLFIGVVAGAILGGIGLYFLLPDDQVATQDQVVPKDEIVFYYGDTCPHCKKVEEYVAQNNVHDKVQFEEKEIYNNKKNSEELTNVAKQCGIAENKVGVPLLWTGEECLVGDKDIIAFFEEKIGMQE